jgi:high-affinity nickel permease
MKSCDVDVRGLAVLQELSSDKLNVTDLRWLSLRRNCGVMPSLLAIVVLGLFLGIRHATDPDHVVAVTTIVSRERTMLHALIIGVLWGLGHTVTILIVGSGILLLKLTIPPRLGLAMELSVACMLILLGVSNLTGLMRRAVEWLAPGGYGSGAHAHIIGGRVMIHTHDAGEFVVQPRGSIFDWLRHWCQRLGTFHVLRPLAIGIVHGLAGSAAVALLLLTTISQPGWAVGYLLVFGIGTIVGMMLITTAIALPFTYTLRHFARLNQVLAIASGAISLSFGLFLCYQIGISDGLFTGHPNWVPR